MDDNGWVLVVVAFVIVVSSSLLLWDVIFKTVENDDEGDDDDDVCGVNKDGCNGNEVSSNDEGLTILPTSQCPDKWSRRVRMEKTKIPKINIW